jgi:hypothetical protein
MYALKAQRHVDVIQCVSHSPYNYIGDYGSNKAVEQYLGNEELIHKETAMFHLEHNDPTLTSLVIGDCFNSMNGRFHSALFDVLDAIYSHQHLTELIFAWDDVNSNLWREGIGWDALITVLCDKTPITLIEVRTSIADLTPIGDLLQHCPQLKSVKIAYDGYTHSGGYGIGTVARYLKKNPVLEDDAFLSMQLYRNNAINLYRTLLKKVDENAYDVRYSN